MSINGAAAAQTTTADPGNNRDGVGDVATISPDQLQDLLPGAGMDDRGNRADNPAADVLGALAGLNPNKNSQTVQQTETAPTQTQTPTPQPITTQKSQTDQTVQTDKDASPSSQPAVDPSGQQPEQPVISDDMKFTVRGSDGQQREITGKEMREILVASKTLENASAGAPLTEESVTESLKQYMAELNTPAMEQKVSQHVEALKRVNETLASHETNLAGWRREKRAAERDDDREARFKAEENIDEYVSQIEQLREARRQLENGRVTAQNNYNQNLNQLSLKAVNAQYPDIGKNGLPSIAFEVQKTFGIPAEIVSDYMLDARFALLASAALNGQRTLGKGAQALSKAEQVPAAFILNTGASSVDANTKTQARRGADPQRGAALVQHSQELLKQGDPLSALMGLANAMGHLPEIEQAMGFDSVIPHDVSWT